MNYTHYDYLDLAPGASVARIEAAYAQVLQRFHFGRTEAGQDLSGLIRTIHAAYRVLSDPDARRAYDDELAREAALADAELKADLDAQASRPSRHAQDVPAPLRLVVNQLAA
ncbi:MAG: DnaJ domain-containing protein [Burkholderiales bacterium]|nr:DnaJ domain-containing protein [Burkholderiales bacterium]